MPRRGRWLAAALAAVVAMGAVHGHAAEQASAALKRADGSDVGVATFMEAPSGLMVKLELKGLPPGPHGVRVHEIGKCEGDFASVGAIYNPLGAKHGFYNEEGPMAGDLPNIYVGQDGIATAEFLSPFLTLNKAAEDGLFDADGAALVVFEKADDHLSDPDGGAGQKIACGAIAIR
ncbi:MAG: superoxide dismutase family protein [Hyphomicrobium sp.]